MIKPTAILLLIYTCSLMATVITITDEKMLTEQIQANDVVVVDYYADWCGPCKLLSPILKELSQEYHTKVTFGKVDIDEEQRLAALARVKSIPYVLFFKGGQVVHAQTGLLTKAEYQQIIDYILAMNKPAQLTDLSAPQFAKALDTTTGLILDVRTKEEYHSGHIKGAVLLPIQTLQANIDALPTDKNSPIFIYCRSGNRSRAAGQIITQAGYTKVSHLEHGIKSWIKAGEPVVTP